MAMLGPAAARACSLQPSVPAHTTASSLTASHHNITHLPTCGTAHVQDALHALRVHALRLHALPHARRVGGAQLVVAPVAWSCEGLVWIL